MKLKNSGQKLRLEAVLITDERGALPTRRVAELNVTLNGFPGDRHYGQSKPAGGREKLFERGSEIFNSRQWSAVSQEELQRIRENMGIPELLPEWLGANMLFSGVDEFSQLPSFTRLKSVLSDSCTLIVYEENHPCKFPQEYIDAGTGTSAEKSFSSAAKGMRGLVGWVEKAGKLKTGMEFEIWIPS